MTTSPQSARSVLEKELGVEVHRFTEKGGHEIGYAKDDRIERILAELTELVDTWWKIEGYKETCGDECCEKVVDRIKELLK